MLGSDRLEGSGGGQSGEFGDGQSGEYGGGNGGQGGDGGYGGESSGWHWGNDWDYGIAVAPASTGYGSSLGTF